MTAPLLKGSEATTERLLRETIARLPKYARNLLLTGYRGSHAHGTYIPPDDPKGTDDVDVFGVYVRDRAYYCGVTGYLRQHDTVTTAGETLDVEAHEMRKFLALLCKGNPNVHSHLWLRPEHYFNLTRAARILLDRRRGFLSQKVLAAFTGYAYDQLSRMQKFEKKGYMGTKREAIVREHGYDVKNAAHCIRLLHCGIHLARTGEILVWLGDHPCQSEVIQVKRGLYSFEQVQRRATELFREYDACKAGTIMSPRADYAFADETALRVMEAIEEDRMAA